MHGAAGHNDRCPRRDVEPFAPAVKAKPAFKHLKDLLSLLVKEKWRPDERRDPSVDDREGPADISAVQAHRHLLASHRIEPIEVLGPADDCLILADMRNCLSARSKATQECRNQPSHRVSVSPGPPPAPSSSRPGQQALGRNFSRRPLRIAHGSPCRREQMVGRPGAALHERRERCTVTGPRALLGTESDHRCRDGVQTDRRRQIDAVIDYLRESREAPARGEG
jgi:hypothetical protein